MEDEYICVCVLCLSGKMLCWQSVIIILVLLQLYKRSIVVGSCSEAEISLLVYVEAYTENQLDLSQKVG